MGSYMNTGNVTADARTRLLSRFTQPTFHSFEGHMPGFPVAPVPAPEPGRAPMAQPIYAPNAASPAVAPVAPASSPVAPVAPASSPVAPVAPASSPAAPPGLPWTIASALAKHKQAAKPDPIYAGLTPEQGKQVGDYFHSLAGFDYKGSLEAARLQAMTMGNLFRQWNMEGPVDYTSAAPIADQFGHASDRLSAMLAARGMNGGVVAGGQSNLQGQQASAVGEYIRKLLAERQAQHHADLARYNDWARGINSQGLAANINEQQHKGAFWKDLLGVAGSIGGGLIGGPVGASIGGSLAGALSNSSSPGYGNDSMGAYGPPDPNKYYGPWQGQGTGI